MPSPPCDGGTHLPSPGTSPSNDAISRGSSDGGGGDGRGSGDSAIGAAGDSPRDVSRDNGSKGHAKHFPSGSSLGKLEAGLQSDNLAAEDGSSSVKISGLSKEETKSYVNDDDSNNSKLGSNFFPEENRNKKPAIDGRYAEAMPEKKMEIMDARNTKSFSVPGKGLALVIPIRDVSEEANVVQSSNKEVKQMDVVQSSNKEVKQMDFQSQEEMNRRASRLGACRSRHRSPSPIDSKVESKRPGVVCQYFSQGWCVNGKNCRFMHNIDSMDNISQQLGGGVATTIRRYESQNDEGRVHQRERAESPRWRQYNGKHRSSSLQGEDLFSSFPSDSQRFLVYKDGPGKYFSPNAEVNYPILGNHLFTEYGSFSVGSSSLTTSSQIYRTSHTTSSHATSLEGLVGKKKEFTLNDDASPVLSHQRTPNVDAQSQTASLLPSHRSLSQNAGHCAHNFSDRDTKTKFSSDDWEPSEPFRPSYFAAFPHMSFTRSVHDIVCDTSKEHPIGDKQHKVSCPIQGASILVSSHQQVHDDPVLPGTLGPDYNADSPSIHIHNIFHERTSEKGVHAHQRDFLANETKHAGSSGAKLKDSLLKEGKPVGLIQVEDVSDQNPVNYSDGASHKEELKIEQDKPSNSYGDHMIDEDMNKESKALKHFRFVLIDFIKDFLRPTWHKGQLSKDAHNSIVKKSVDKVLSTLESHQIPSTKEAIHHYLSMSQPKIAKLVQGYVEKHQRTNSGISVL